MSYIVGDNAYILNAPAHLMTFQDRDEGSLRPAQAHVLVPAGYREPTLSNTHLTSKILVLLEIMKRTMPNWRLTIVASSVYTS